MRAQVRPSAIGEMEKGAFMGKRIHNRPKPNGRSSQVNKERRERRKNRKHRNPGRKRK